MKTSRRLLLGTFLAILVAPVVLVAYSRIGGTGSTRELPLPERATPAELAALRDFTEIDVRGDFALEIVSAPDYSIEYTPLTERRGNFRARVESGRLTIEGFGNRTEFAAAEVRIGMPDLDEVDAETLDSLTVRNFDGDDLDLRLVFTRELVLENNRIDSLRLELQATESVELLGNTIGTSSVRHFGTIITTD